MAKNFNELVKKMPAAARAQAKVRAKDMMAEMLLSEIRKEAGLTQADLAKAIDIRQPSLSKLETQDDMQISTLRKIIQALGGRLELVAHLPQGDIRISQFQD